MGSTFHYDNIFHGHLETFLAWKFTEWGIFNIISRDLRKYFYISNDPYGTKIQWFDFTWNFLGPPRFQHPYEENMCCTWSRILLVWSCRQFLLPVLFIYTLLYSDNFSIKIRSISYLVIMSWGSKWSYVAKSPNLIQCCFCIGYLCFITQCNQISFNGI